MVEHRFRLLLSIGLAGLLGGCATSQPARLSIRNVGGAPLASADESAIERGKMFLARGQLADAISAFRTALRQEQDSAEAHNGLAIAYERIGRKDLARRYFELAYAEKPHVERYRSNLARHFGSNGQPDLALGLAAAPATTALIDKLEESVALLTPESVVTLVATEALPTELMDSQIQTILADFSSQRFTAEDMYSDIEDEDKPLVALPMTQGAKTEFAVYRPNVATAIEAMPINIPSGPAPHRDPIDGNIDFIADLPRNDRRASISNGPYIERVSLGEVKLITAPQPKTVAPPTEFRLSDHQIAQWIEDERRRELYQNHNGLHGRLAIQRVIERLAIEEATNTAALLAKLVDQMDQDFVYIAFDDIPESTEA
jgi:uncharacterized protein YqcC (DUF446 family)